MLGPRQQQFIKTVSMIKNIAAGINDTSGKFAAGVNDTGGK
jgi:hypothetical protein